MKLFPRKTLMCIALAGCTFAACTAQAQSTAPLQAPQPAAAPQTVPEPTPPLRGTVLIQSHGEPPNPATAQPQEVAPATKNPAGPESKEPELTDRERSAILFTAYDLDARLMPASSQLNMRARLTLRNDGSEPLTRIALQISSTLIWNSASLIASARAQGPQLPLAQHLLETDADHTGKANEAVLTLPQPLAPGASLTLDTFYSGTITTSGERLERIGATPAQALGADWDAIAPEATSLRGFGNVLWYPVAAPQLFLGDGAKLFQEIGQMRLREQNASIHLRISVEYGGDPPTAVYFCGRRQSFKALSDDADAPTASGHGIATAEFTAEPLGFRMPSLFVVERPENLIAPLPAMIDEGTSHSHAASRSAGIASGATSSSLSGASASSSPQTVSDESVPDADGAPMLAVETTEDDLMPQLAASTEAVAPLLQQWFGARPLTALTVVDHNGQPFEDGPLLVAPLDSLAASSSSTALAHSLTHAWVQTGQPWMDEGLAQFIALLWTEREQGRDAALAQLDELMKPLILAEPDSGSAQAADSSKPLRQPLIAASDEIYYRRKAAAVWWMLRGIAGDDSLRLALSAWRTQPASHDTPQAQAIAFEKLLEKTSGKDLAWFFNDWVLRDRGLPDLSIVDVEPRQLPAGAGHNSGWLVAVTVRNDGAAAAEVPLVIRSGDFSTTRQILVRGLASATERVVVEAPPTEVVVNDGGTPELRSSVHSRTVVLQTQ